MCTPTINDAPINTREQTSSALSINIVKTAARRATAVLRVLRKRYRASYAILFHTSCGLIRQGTRIAECDVTFVGRCCWMQLVE
jgi:hypothetical protein